MKKHYETHVEDTDKLISVAGPVLDYKSWYEQYRKLMEEQAHGYFSTDEDDEKVLDWYKKQYPWLFPDQAWTVVGKTNEDEDRATIANITGNGNDLILSNFGFAKGSGYGLYQQNYAIWTKVSNRATFTVTSSKIHVTSVTAEEHADFIYTIGQQLKQILQ